MPTLTKLYPMQEVSLHNSQDDCWVTIDGKFNYDCWVTIDGKSPVMIIGSPFDGKVYDVSSYMDEHPGGDDVLLSATGKDATDEFEDAGHSKSARELMESFCIGELEVPTPLIPELEIVSKKQQNDIVEKLRDMSKQYWTVPVAVVGITVVASFLYSRRN